MSRFLSLNLLYLASMSANVATGFHLAVPLRFGTALHSTSADGKPVSTVISPDDVDFQFDTGLGGVRLAEESYLKMNGSIKHKGGSATASFQDLLRYTDVREVPESQVMEQLENLGAKVICTGRGQELYKDPGSGTDKVVILGPLDAAEDAGKGAVPAAEAAEVVINVIGGEDLQILEVKDAMELLVPKLVIGKAKVRFHSLSFSSFPLGQVTITAVALPEDASSNGLHGVEKAIADGEVYYQDGHWWTVVEQDINTALA